MHNSKVLIIDSSVSMRSGLKALLRSLSVDIIEASNGMDAFNLASENPVDLIITSIDLPKMDGLELCRQIRKTSDLENLPLIVLSSFDSDADIEKALDAGASAYIVKREALTRLYDTVQEFLIKPSPQHGKTILLVDDSRTIRTQIKAGLMDAGFNVLTAGNGKEALDVLSKTIPDLILTDLNMPEMDGFQLCEAIRSDPAFATIPVVVISTVSERKKMRHIIQAGATDYMLKPFNVDELVIHIERFLADRFQILLKEKERLDTEREMMFGAIDSLMTVMEARDPRLREHVEAVAEIAAGMATLLGASKKEVELITLGAKLHDIGKIALKDAILFKTTPLDEQDWAFIQQHPRIGSEMIKPIPHLPSDIVSIVLFHHERPDGKGYPIGLKAEQIPQLVSIMAVANRYHEFTHDTIYGKGVSQQEALQRIQQGSGTEFYPPAVSLLLEWVNPKPKS